MPLALEVIYLFFFDFFLQQRLSIHININIYTPLIQIL